MIATLDHTLADLPVRDALAPQNHAAARAYLDQRHAACLRVADSTLALADTVNRRGDTAAAADLIAEARTYLAEAERIDARRV